MSGGPGSLAAAMEGHGEYRAGGTDLQQRVRSGVSRGPTIDLTGIAGLDRIDWDDRGRARIGALVRMDVLAADPRLTDAYPALARSAAALATPQIRAVGTLGGNLLQRSRCWYYRHPDTTCLKKGGTSCPARAGNHLYGVCFDLGTCVAPHPSTLGAALLAYDTDVEIAGAGLRSVTELYGDGGDGSRDHRLEDGELLTAVWMPIPLAGERAAYFRAIGRALAEWPLAEAVVRLSVIDGAIAHARVAVGGVAPVPLRLEQVEQALVDRPASGDAVDDAAALAGNGASPLPMTGYKVELLRATVREALVRALDA